MIQRWLGLGALAAVTLWPAQGLAVVEPQAGLRVAPVLQNVNLGQQDPSAHFDMTINNNTAVDQAFRFEVQDFGSLNESGGVAFLGSAPSDFKTQHGLAKWLGLDQNAAVVPAHGSLKLGVTVKNDASLSPGGHYGAVLAEALTAPDSPAGSSRVGITQVLSSLVLLVKGGAAPPTLRLLSQGLGGGGWWAMPSALSLRFENQGQVHVVPRGTVEIRDPLGRMVGRGELNEDSGTILPGDIRRYQTPLVALASAWMPGRYTVVTDYRYDGSEAHTKSSTSFWFLGWSGIAVFVLVLVVGLVGAWWWTRRRRRLETA